MKKKLLVYALISLFVNVSDAQIPDTDIYLIPAKYENGKIILGKAVNITSSPGYDNHPCFSPDSKEILFVSIKDSVQSDVWKYDIATKTKVQLTKTKESEYSPTYIKKGKSISVVRVDKDSIQRFYKMDYPAMKKTEMIKGSEGIGYSCWINDSLVAGFYVDKINNLKLMDLTNLNQTHLYDNPGRCMKINPVSKSLFIIDKNDSASNYLCEVDVERNKVGRIVKTLKGSEDFDFLKNGLIIFGHDGKFFTLSEDRTEWIPVSEPIEGLSGDFYRFAISPDNKYIAVVSYKGQKP
ncbi:MAG: PD40 domain-containing protein [Bacteroidetes bacterium]|nr:PD40 domain-containing protein [Bacteroidota bacterium]